MRPALYIAPAPQKVHGGCFREPNRMVEFQESLPKNETAGAAVSLSPEKQNGTGSSFE